MRRSSALSSSLRRCRCRSHARSLTGSLNLLSDRWTKAVNQSKNTRRINRLAFRWLWLCGLCLLLAAPAARAQLQIEITGATAQRTPIAIAPFAGEAALGSSVTGVVRADLERSGLFRALELPTLNPVPTEASSVSYPEWRSRLADALVVGSVSSRPDGRF